MNISIIITQTCCKMCSSQCPDDVPAPNLGRVPWLARCHRKLWLVAHSKYRYWSWLTCNRSDRKDLLNTFMRSNRTTNLQVIRDDFAGRRFEVCRGRLLWRFLDDYCGCARIPPWYFPRIERHTHMRGVEELIYFHLITSWRDSQLASGVLRSVRANPWTQQSSWFSERSGW